MAQNGVSLGNPIYNFSLCYWGKKIFWISNKTICSHLEEMLHTDEVRLIFSILKKYTEKYNGTVSFLTRCQAHLFKLSNQSSNLSVNRL